MKNFKPQTKAPKGAICACGDNLGPHFLAAGGGLVKKFGEAVADLSKGKVLPDIAKAAEEPPPDFLFHGRPTGLRAEYLRAPEIRGPLPQDISRFRRDVARSSGAFMTDRRSVARNYGPYIYAAPGVDFPVEVDWRKAEKLAYGRPAGEEDVANEHHALMNLLYKSAKETGVPGVRVRGVMDIVNEENFGRQNQFLLADPRRAVGPLSLIEEPDRDVLRAARTLESEYRAAINPDKDPRIEAAMRRAESQGTVMRPVSVSDVFVSMKKVLSPEEFKAREAAYHKWFLEKHRFADGGSVPESRAPWAPAPRFSSAGEPSWGDVWEVIKSQGPAAIQAWLRKQAEYMANRAAPYYGGQRQVNGAANLKEQLDMLAGTARGATAATLGAFGDLQSLGRAAMAAPRGPLSALEALQQPTVFPKSEELKKGERGFLARGAGTPGESVGEAFGDFVPIIPPSAVRAGARAAGRGVEAVGRRVERGVERGLEDPGIIGDITRAAGRTFAAAPARAVKPKGGNFAENRLANYLDNLGVWTPELDELGIPAQTGFGNGPEASEPVARWMQKQLRNYIRKDLGTPTDPLLAVEREFPDLHLPEGSFTDATAPAVRMAQRVNAYPQRQAFTDANAPTSSVAGMARVHRSLTDQPLTPWGAHSGSGLHRIGPMEYAADIVSGGAVPGRSPMEILREAWETEVPGSLQWLEKAPPDTPIWSLTDPYTDELGFGHVRDYLEAATEAHKTIGGGAGTATFSPEILARVRAGQAGTAADRRMLALQDAGLTLDPESLGRLSVADAVRKTAQWNKFMADQSTAEGPLSKGWKEFKAYPDKGMRWVEFGKPESVGLPDDYEVSPMSNGNGFRVAKKGSDDWGHVGATPEEAIQKFHGEQVRTGLGAEGDAMGHCVGGYCDDVLTRGTKIYSLRDAKGKPHVTIEVRPSRSDVTPQQRLDMMPGPQLAELGIITPEQGAALGDHWLLNDWERVTGQRAANYNQWLNEAVKKLKPEEPSFDIIQIKGKGNAAPAADYLPFVQDFVRSGKWGRVGDLRNAGLRKYGDVFGAAELEKLIKDGKLPPDVSADGYTTLDEVLKLTDPVNHDIHRAAWAPLRGYARGGRVEERDPEGFLPRTLDETVDYALRVFGKQ